MLLGVVVSVTRDGVSVTKDGSECYQRWESVLLGMVVSVTRVGSECY